MQIVSAVREYVTRKSCPVGKTWMADGIVTKNSQSNFETVHKGLVDIVFSVPFTLRISELGVSGVASEMIYEEISRVMPALQRIWALSTG